MRKGPDYTCDKCRCVLSDRGTGEDHLSIVIGPDSGLASMRGERLGLEGWRITEELRPRRYHFCNPEHMAEYLAAVLYADQPLRRFVN